MSIILLLSWTNVFVALAEIILALYVFTTRTKGLINIFYFIFSVAVALWVYSIGGFYIFSGPVVEELHLQASYIAASLIMSALFLFAMVFPFQKRRLGLEHYAFALLPLIGFSIATFMDQLLVDYAKNPTTEYFLGPLYPAYAAYIIGYFGIAIALLFEKYRMSDGIHRWQLKNLILSMLFAGIMGITFNLILELFGISYLNHVGTLASVIWFSATLYIVMKR